MHVLHTRYLLINAYYRFDNTWSLSNKGKGLSQSKQNKDRSKSCDKVYLKETNLKLFMSWQFAFFM